MMASFVSLQAQHANMMLSPLNIPLAHQNQTQSKQSFSKLCPESSAPNADRASPSSEGRTTPSSGSSTATPEETERMAEYLRELQAERDEQEAAAAAAENCHRTPHLVKLLEQEIGRVQLCLSAGSSCGQASMGVNGRDATRILDVYRERPIRLTVRVLVPAKEHPKFNFVGKLLGPKGNSMKRLQEETMTKMAVLGRGSMRDKQKEEELRACADAKYQHLHEDLHVEITAFAPPAEAHARIAYALTEVRKYLIPDSNDEIRQEQMREMELLAANNNDSASASAAAAMASAAAAAAAIVSGDPVKRAAAAAALQAYSSGLRSGAAAAPSHSHFRAASGATPSQCSPLQSMSSASTYLTSPAMLLLRQQQQQQELLLDVASSPSPTIKDSLCLLDAMWSSTKACASSKWRHGHHQTPYSRPT